MKETFFDEDQDCPERPLRIYLYRNTSPVPPVFIIDAHLLAVSQPRKEFRRALCALPAFMLSLDSIQSDPECLPLEQEMPRS